MGVNILADRGQFGVILGDIGKQMVEGHDTFIPGKDDKAELRQACEQILGRKLIGGTTGNLSSDEAGTLLTRLGALDDREQLIALLAQLSGDAQ